jgi:hypothetical protein
MRKLMLAGLLCGVGCKAFSPAEDGAERFTPPPSYREMWAVAEACSGRRGSFGAITWWVVPDTAAFYLGPDGWADGNYRAGTITLAGDRINHPMVVRHEMLHALGLKAVKRDGYFEHPAVFTTCKATWASWDRSEPMLELTPELRHYLSSE